MSDICRLCLSSELLVNLLGFDGDPNLNMKITSCVGIQVVPNDGLPSLICKDCIEIVKMFYNFQQKCLEVDLKLRKLTNTLSLAKIENVGQNIEEKSLKITSKYAIQAPNHNKINDLDIKIIENKECYQKNWMLPKGGENDDFKFKFKHKDDKTTMKNKFQCEICGRIFKIKTRLDTHLLTHSGLKPYQCKLCPKRYCRAESVTIHMRSHAGIKPYVCEVCGKTSTKRQDLVRHMKIHSDERNYTCPTCERHFKRASDVTSHMRTHTGIRPYQCKICQKSYTSHSGLRKHYKLQCKSEVNEQIN